MRAAHDHAVQTRVPVDSVAVVTSKDHPPGTAFGIGAGWLCTAAHVVRGASGFTVRRGGTGAAWAVEVVELPGRDVSLLRCKEWPAEACLPVADDLPPLDSQHVTHAFATKIESPVAGPEIPPDTPVSGIRLRHDHGDWVQLQSDTLTMGMSGAPIVDEKTGLAWAVFCVARTAHLTEGLRDRDRNYAVAIRDILDEVRRHVDVPATSVNAAHLREQLREHGAGLLWHPAADPRLTASRSNSDVPYFAAALRPVADDIARGEAFRLPALERAAAFLRGDSDGSRWVVVRGPTASGKSSCGLLVAYEQRENAVILTIDSAEPNVEKAIELAAAAAGTKRLLLLIDRPASQKPHLLATLEHRLDYLCRLTGRRVDLVLVGPPDELPAEFADTLHRRLARDRALIIDAGHEGSSAPTESVFAHASRAWRLYGIDLVHTAPPTGTKDLGALLSHFSAGAERKPPPVAERPSWLTEKLTEWVALYSRYDTPLPWDIAWKAIPVVRALQRLGVNPPPGYLEQHGIDPDEIRSGSFDPLKISWNAVDGLKFGHSKIALAFPLADPAKTALELLDRARESAQSADLWPIFEAARDNPKLKDALLIKLQHDWRWGQSLLSELHYAGELQRGFDHAFPETEGYDIAQATQRAEALTSEFFVAFADTPRAPQVLFAIGQASGSGARGALLAERVIGALHAADSSEGVLSRLQAADCALDNSRGNFATLWAGILDPEEHVIESFRAGFQSPLLVRDGRTVEVQSRHLPVLIGVLPLEGAPEAQPVRPGDVVVAYTDGVVEALRESPREVFGEERLIDVLRDCGDLTATEIVARIFDALDRFRGAPLDHDRSVLVIKRI